MIIFTYAVICPVILPFGALYFGFSLIVYKKQILYVYQPVYESGGAMFPGSLQKTVLSLVLGQLTLAGYLLTRKAVFQGIFLLPLPFTTIWVMKFFDEHYGSTLRNQSVLLFRLFWLLFLTPLLLPLESSTKLSLERAREYDRVSEWLAANKNRSVGEKSDGLDPSQKQKVEHGIEGRRRQFQKDSYRQPVLTRKPMNPRNYRRGQPDPEAEFCTRRLQELNEENYSRTAGIHTMNEESLDAEAGRLPSSLRNVVV